MVAGDRPDKMAFFIIASRAPGRSMDSAEQIDDTQQDGPSDENQKRRVHDHADRFTSFCQVSPFISHFAAAS
jgi:hypothetical protein